MSDPTTPHDYMPKADEALRFIKSNPRTAMDMLGAAIGSADDEWAAGFCACLYLFNGHYGDYQRERDTWLQRREMKKCTCAGLAGEIFTPCPVHP